MLIKSLAPTTSESRPVSPALCFEDEVDAQQSEDAAAIEIIKDAHKKSSSRFKVAANDSFDDDYDIDNNGNSSDEEEVELQAVAQLSKRQQSEMKKLRIDGAHERPQYLAESDPYYDNASKNRNSRYRPSAKALENTFGNF